MLVLRLMLVGLGVFYCSFWVWFSSVGGGFGTRDKGNSGNPDVGGRGPLFSTRGIDSGSLFFFPPSGVRVYGDREKGCPGRRAAG